MRPGPNAARAMSLSAKRASSFSGKMGRKIIRLPKGIDLSFTSALKVATPVLFLSSLLFGCTVNSLSTSGQNSRTLTLVAVGDTNGHNIMSTESQLGSVGELVAGKDIFIFNAEGVFSERLHEGDCRVFKKQSLFLGPSEVIDSLPRGEITVASLANNHALDCGREGLLETMQELRRHGILTVGAGDNPGEACKPLMVSIKGLNVAILSYLEMDPAVIAYIGMDPDWFSAGPNKTSIASWKLCDGQKQLAVIRKYSDIVVVFVHMHNTTHSWTEKPDAAGVLFLKNILDAGADLVLGSGPHFPQGIIRNDKGGVALLSLGNFLLRPDYKMPEKGHRSILADFTISDDRLRLSIVPLRLDISGRPQVASGEEADIILNRIVFLSNHPGTAIEIRRGRGVIETPRIPAE